MEQYSFKKIAWHTNQLELTGKLVTVIFLSYTEKIKLLFFSHQPIWIFQWWLLISEGARWLMSDINPIYIYIYIYIYDITQFNLMMVKKTHA